LWVPDGNCVAENIKNKEFRGKLFQTKDLLNIFCPIAAMNFLTGFRKMLIAG